MQKLAMAFVIMTLLAAVPCLGTWAEDGIPLYQGSASLASKALVPDGAGGGYFVRVELTTVTQLKVTHFDGNGSLLWDIQVPGYSSSSQSMMKAVSDGNGGVLIAYYSYVTGFSFSLIYNRVLFDGSLPLGSGVQISNSTSAFYPQIMFDGSDVFFAWQTSTTDGDIYGQKTNLDGTIQWVAGEVPLVTNLAHQSSVLMTTDGAGGIICSWQDFRNTNYDIYCQRLDSAGTPLWTADGVPLCTDFATQYILDIVKDQQGGAVFVWSDYRTGVGNLMAQRIDATGATRWAVDGQLVSSPGVYVSQTAVTDLPNGHTMVSWAESSAGTTNILVQNVAPDGTLVLGANGSIIAANLPLDIGYIQDGFTTSSGDGMVVVWKGSKYGEYDIYSQRCDRAGNGIFPSSRMAVCKAVGDQTKPMVIPDNDKGLFVVWNDGRSNPNHYYAQHQTSTGFWGNPGAPLTSVQDVPDDQGGVVNVDWNPSRLDAFPANEVTFYTLWRSLPVAKINPDAKLIIRPADRRTHKDEKVVLATPGANKANYWEYMFSVVPRGLPGYGKTLPTPYDSVSVASPPIDYMVVTETAADSVYFMSTPLAALSVDNLAPIAVKGLHGTLNYGPSSIDLIWQANAEGDLDHYNLYRGTTPGFVPDQTSLVSTVADTTFLDTSGDSGSYYRLAAVDIHGNEGPDVLLNPAGVSGVGDTIPVVELAISRVAPNPFNPVTTIEFTVPNTGQVRLEIYDLAGRRVRTLVNEVLPTGPGKAVWRGVDDSGRPTASGTYLARLTGEGLVVTRSLTLVK